MFLLPFSILAEDTRTPLERNRFKRVTSHVELLTYIQQLTAQSNRLILDTIGRSVQGRPIPLIHVIPNGNRRNIKVLLFCQQHGNEPSGKEAALEVIRLISSAKTDLYPNLDLYIIPSLNPDGNESGKRMNANNEDLNRDHTVLSQPETQVLHAAVAGIRPDVTLDVHEFSAYRKEFLSAGYVRAVDEQFGAPTNLNVPLSIRTYAYEKLFPFLNAELANKQIRFSNYLKMDGPGDTVRPSTTSIGDGRQSFAIRGVFSFILEGKNGRNGNDDLKRRTEQQTAAIDAFLRFVNQQTGEISSMMTAERMRLMNTADSVVISMDYRYHGVSISLPMSILATGLDTLVQMKNAPEVEPMKSVHRPAGYIIPKHQTEILDLLRRHNVTMEIIVKPESKTIETYSIERVQPVWMENKPKYSVSVTAAESVMTVQPGDVIVPMSQVASTMLVIMLEPGSMWGIIQDEQFAHLRREKSLFPIYRLKRDGM